jgi:starch synthase (maltosyl-transferring)
MTQTPGTTQTPAPPAGPARPAGTGPARSGATRSDPATPAGGAPAQPPAPPAHSVVGRIPVLAVGPVVDGGRWAARAVVGEPVPVTATVFREGHDAVAATVVLTDPDGAVHTRVRMHSLGPGLDRWGATVVPDREGRWSFRVEGWSDAHGTWEHDAVIKVGAGVDVELMLEEGARRRPGSRPASRPTCTPSWSATRFATW